MLSGANAFEISDIQEDETEVVWLAKMSSQARGVKNQQHPVRNLEAGG
jgi:hypothetical protein